MPRVDGEAERRDEATAMNHRRSPKARPSALGAVLAAATLPLLAAACDNKQVKSEPTPVTSASAPRVAAPKLDKLTRAEFNRFAAELALPLFWTEDANKDGALDPGELAVYWGLDPKATIKDYVAGGSFTPKMTEAYDRIVKQKTEGAKSDDARKAAVKKELAQGRVTLVATDLSKADEAEKRFVASIIKASELIEDLYAKQQAVTDLAKKVPADDPASKTLFFRGQGPKCEAPLTKDDPSCGALLPADMPKTKLSGMYPADLLAQNPKFCEELL
jgi:hypothetical protein